MEKSMIDRPDDMYYKNVVISIHIHRKALQWVCNDIVAHFSFVNLDTN